MYRLAIDTTRRRFDWTNVCWADSPWRTVRRISRFFAGVNAILHAALGVMPDALGSGG